MKKQLVYFIAGLIVLVQTSACSFAKTDSLTSIAIKKYKRGNYTGCLQDCQYITQVNPSNIMAYYYMAMSYVQAGKKDEAIQAYSKVLSLNPSSNTRLAEYARTGKRCLETPDQCKLAPTTTNVAAPPSTTPEIDKLIASPAYESPTVRKDLQQKRLNSIKNDINSDKELDDYQFRKINQADTAEKIALAEQKKPTNEDIAAAFKTLNDAGINPYTQNPMSSTANPYAQMNNYQNPELAQINMLMGGNKQTNDSSSIMNMLPYMMTQDKNGTSNYSPQAMQAVIMNSMMTDFNYDLDKDK